MSIVSTEIENIENSIANLVKFSYQSEVYNSPISQAIESTRYQLGKNIEYLKQTIENYGAM